MSRNALRNVRATSQGHSRARAVPARAAGFLQAPVYPCAKAREGSHGVTRETPCSEASDEVAEALVRGILSPDRATFFGRHIAVVRICAEEVENTRAFVLALCDALRAIDA
jgi:hypothetical protein